MEQVIQFDEWLLLAVNGMNNEYIDPIMMAFTGKAVWILMYVAIAAVIWWRYGWRKALVIVALAGIAVGMSDWICASVIRPLCQRMRPSNLDNPLSAMVHIVDGYRSGAYGFPSCHAANTFALATFTSLVLRDRAYVAFIFIWAALQCYSRMYLGVHYPGDIAVGAIVGTLIAWGVYSAMTAKVDIRAGIDPKAKTTPVIITGVVLTLFIIVKSLV